MPIARAVTAAVVATMAAMAVDMYVASVMLAPPTLALLTSELASAMAPMETAVCVLAVTPVAPPPPPYRATKTPVALLIGPALPPAPVENVVPSAPSVIPSSINAMARF